MARNASNEIKNLITSQQIGFYNPPWPNGPVGYNGFNWKVSNFIVSRIVFLEKCYGQSIESNFG